MNAEMRFFFDSNVMISAALLPRSVPRQAIDLASELGQLLLSPEVYTELARILRKDRFDRYASIQTRFQFLKALVRSAILIKPTESERVTACRDPDDDKFLTLAVAGSATCLVSGDTDLLSLDPFQDIPILTPRAFLDRFTKELPGPSEPSP